MKLSTFSLNSQLRSPFIFIPTIIHWNNHSYLLVQNITGRTERHWPCSLEVYNTDKHTIYDTNNKYLSLMCQKQSVTESDSWSSICLFWVATKRAPGHRGRAIGAEERAGSKHYQYTPRREWNMQQPFLLPQKTDAHLYSRCVLMVRAIISFHISCLFPFLGLCLSWILSSKLLSHELELWLQ